MVLASQVQASNQRILKQLHLLQQRIRSSPHLHDLPVAEAVILHAGAKMAEAKRPWKPQTMHRELCLLQSGLSNLPKFAYGADCALKLSESPLWANYMTAWQRKLPGSQPIHQPAATAADITAAVELAGGNKDLRAFMVLLWLSAGRKGDVLQLTTKHTKISDDGRLTSLIQAGKGVIARKGAYHIVSQVPTCWRAEMQQFLAAAAASRRPLLFPQTEEFSAEIPRLLKKANLALDGARSVRRGALIRIAQDPTVTEEILMKLSGHRSKDTLHRYLDWNLHNEHMHSKSVAAAANLDPEAEEA
jgi:hypothetical protein